jgi:hypothetical protein
MSDAQWNALEAWDQTLVRDDEGDVAICFGLAVDFYFRDGQTPEKRRAVLECFSEYERLFETSLRWWVVENKSISSVAKLKNRDMSPYLLSPKWETPEAYEEAWSFVWHGGERKEDASPIRMEGFGPSRFAIEHSGELAYLRASFPVNLWANRVEQLLQLVLRWSARLQVVHGYGGLTLIQSLDDGLAQLYESQEYGYGMRYPGIEIDDPLGTANSTQQGIKGGNWITLLGAEYLAKLGGVVALRQLLGAEFRVHEYVGGTMIVAGPAPDIGDRNRGIDAPHLRALAAVLRPLRTPRHWPVQARGKFSDADEFNAWLGRFD